MIVLDKYTILKKYFGYESFRYPQEDIIDTVLSGQDTIAILPTGFGKSITFQIPALMLEGMTVVISPLIALMEDQKKHLVEKGITAEVIHSNMSLIQQDQVISKIHQKKIKLLYVSPERLENVFFRKELSNIFVNLIVVDEAHTILWAESFRKAFAHISDFIKLYDVRPKVMAVTATATQATLGKIKSYLDLNEPKVIGIGMDRPNLFYGVESPKNKLDFIIRYLKRHLNEKGIVYCLTRRKVEDLQKSLKKVGISSVIYHGGLNADIKYLQQELFTSGIEKLMICTNAFGMGIDVPDIRFVLHFELPSSIEDLVQQMGRAARDGKTAEGIVLFSFSDIHINEYFIQSFVGPNKIQIQKEQQKKLDQVVDFCLSKICRHQLLANYFGQKISSCKTMCDNCKKLWIGSK